MSVSLTSSGLYLEPRAYTSGDGVNYGTPKFVSSSTSLGGGTWSGIYFALSTTRCSNADSGNLTPPPYMYLKTYWGVESGVSSSSGGGIYFRVS